MAGRTQLNHAEIEALKARYPELPTDYFDYLLNVGWGFAESGWMIYSGPVSPATIFGSRFDGSSIVLLGDDTQGYCLGFERQLKRLGEISDSGNWRPFDTTKTFSDYTRDTAPDGPT